MVCIIMTRHPIFALTLPVLHRTTGLSPVPPQLLVRVQHQRNWALHISVRRHAEGLLLSHKHHREGSDSPFRIFHSRSHEWYVPVGQHLLLAARIPTAIGITLMYRPPIPLSVSLQARLPGHYTPSLVARILEHLMLLHLDRKVIAPRSEGICYSTSNDIISSVSTTTVPVCEPASPCCQTGNNASSTSEIQRLAFSVVLLVTSLSTSPISVPPSRTGEFSSSLSRLIG